MPLGAALLVAVASPSLLSAQDLTLPETDVTWDDLEARPAPEWFRDAKLGIFVHWGVYSVPAYSDTEQYAEWYLRGLQLGDTLRTRFMAEEYPEVEEYRDFAPLFRARLFDPDRWADLFRRAGARYVVLVSKHHDGYALWPSEQAEGWNSADVGPGRDLVGELTEAVRDAGLRMGLYYSLGEWNNPLYRWQSDPPEAADRYVHEHMIPQLVDLVLRYRPVVLFGDGDWGNTAERWRTREFLSWYYLTVGDQAIANDRWGPGSRGGFRTPEYSAGLADSDRVWAEVRGLGRSFGLNRKETLDAYMTPRELVHFFTRTVAVGGGMILNVGPTADGRIPLLQQERLVQLGEWLEINGDAIYGSTAWERVGEETGMHVERLDPTIDFDWVRNSPHPGLREDEFSVEWDGWLEPDASGDYALTLRADDRATLWLDERELLNTEAGTTTATVSLTEGQRRRVRVSYEEDRQNASVRLLWARAGEEAAPIPPDRWFVTDDPGAPQGLTGEYRSMRHWLVYTRTGDELNAIVYGWPEGELRLPLVSPPPAMTVRLLGWDEPLPWTYGTDEIIVDVSSIPYHRIPGDWAWTFRLEGYLKN